MQKSKIAQAIEGNSMLVFKPQNGFYESVQINKKRWGLIYRGKREATQSEIERLSTFFQIPVQNFFIQTNPELLA